MFVHNTSSLQACLDKSVLKRPQHGLIAQFILVVVSLQSSISLYAEEVAGVLDGYGGNSERVTVVLESREELRTATPNESGEFTFSDVETGTYFLKVVAPGYQTTPARQIKVPVTEPLEPFTAKRITSDDFVFHWEEDQTAAGYEYSSVINQPVQVEFLGELSTVSDSRSASYLLNDFNIALVDDERTWTPDHSFRLHQAMSATDSDGLKYSRADNGVISRWYLTADEIGDDIEITRYEDGSQDVRIASAAFANASPKMVAIDGHQGIWHSRRLHHAITRFVTHNGTNRKSVQQILDSRYGVDLEPNFHQITEYTTGETSSSFQQFKPEELIDLIAMFEEMPKGFHSIPELKYVVRRIDGMNHPLYPTAPAVAWPDQGYIEFMESAFTQSEDDIHRLILHEKAHFLWSHVIEERTREDWIEVGRWYEDPTQPSGWATELTTQFVSAYAHEKNPNEDLAESIADFVLNPDVLKSRAPSKYAFIRDRLMAGNFYISKIREDLTFEVYNLYPDYVYPGKIKRVDVRVAGQSEEDKVIDVEIELHALDLEAEAAKKALTRVVSDLGTYFDLHLRPVDLNGNRVGEGLVLRGQKQLSKYAKAGYWRPINVRISDKSGNWRYQRDNTFELKVYVNNPLEDYFEPQYSPESIQLRKHSEVREYWGIDREVHVINVSWDFDENRGLRDRSPCYASLVVDRENTGSFFEYGKEIDKRCSVDFDMPNYMPSGEYSVRRVGMKDQANNDGQFVFLSDGSERSPTIDLHTTNPDLNPPELNVNRIFVDAKPTNPDNPNGETQVTIRYDIRDDNSGLYDTGIRLRDPQGGARFQWHLPPDRANLFSRAPAGEWQELTMVWLLPEGSPPGIWGIQSMWVQDKASNDRKYSFTETIQVEVQNRANTMLIR